MRMGKCYEFVVYMTKYIFMIYRHNYANPKTEKIKPKRIVRII